MLINEKYNFHVSDKNQIQQRDKSKYVNRKIKIQAKKNKSLQ